MRECIIIVLSECDPISQDICLRALGAIDDIALLVLDGYVERALLEKICLELIFHNYYVQGNFKKKKQTKTIRRWLQ